MYEPKDLERMQERREACRQEHQNGNGFGLTLGQAAQGWATPTVDDANNVTRDSGQTASLARDTYRWSTPHRAEDVLAWNTPAAHEGRLGFQDRSSGKKGSQVSVTTDAVLWAGETASPSAVPTEPSGSSPAPPPRRGLNPRFGLWLMGYPVEWLSCVEWGTRSSPRARSKDSSASKPSRRSASKKKGARDA
jgi:hypothetical protein